MEPCSHTHPNRIRNRQFHTQLYRLMYNIEIILLNSSTGIFMITIFSRVMLRLPTFYSKKWLSADVAASQLLKHCCYSIFVAMMLPHQRSYGLFFNQKFVYFFSYTTRIRIKKNCLLLFLHDWMHIKIISLRHENIKPNQADTLDSTFTIKHLHK